MKVKNLSKFCIVLSTVVALAACGGSGEVDPRDQFVGGYNYESTGKAVIKLGIITYDIPLSGKGNFTISETSGVPVQLTFTYDKATLTDNQLTWESSVKAFATYSGYAVYGDGTVSVVATKQ